MVLLNETFNSLTVYGVGACLYVLVHSLSFCADRQAQRAGRAYSFARRRASCCQAYRRYPVQDTYFGSRCRTGTLRCGGPDAFTPGTRNLRSTLVQPGLPVSTCRPGYAAKTPPGTRMGNARAARPGTAGAGACVGRGTRGYCRPDA